MKREHDKKTNMLVTTAPEADCEDKIRQRAYENCEVRGRKPGDDLDDWLRAEAEVTGDVKPIAA